MLSHIKNETWNDVLNTVDPENSVDHFYETLNNYIISIVKIRLKTNLVYTKKIN